VEHACECEQDTELGGGRPWLRQLRLANLRQLGIFEKRLKRSDERVAMMIDTCYPGILLSSVLKLEDFNGRAKQFEALAQKKISPSLPSSQAARFCATSIACDEGMPTSRGVDRSVNAMPWLAWHSTDTPLSILPPKG